MMMVRRIRLRRRIEHPGPTPTTTTLNTTAAAASANLRPGIITSSSAAILHRTTPPPNEEALAVVSAPLEQNDVAGVEALFLHVAAPPFGQDVALAAVPVRVAEPPALAGLVLETQQQALLGAGRVSAAEGEVLLGVLLGNDEAVQLADVARRQRLLEHGLLVVDLLQFSVGGVVVLLVEVEVEIEGRGLLGAKPGGLVILIQLRVEITRGSVHRGLLLTSSVVPPLRFLKVGGREMVQGHFTNR